MEIFLYNDIGVYQVVCKITEKRYVGSTTVSFKSRWATHKRLLRSGKHHSIKLQKAWNKYGENNFLFLILDILPAQDCLIYEQTYLDCLGKDNLLNIKLTANIYPDNNSKERREKLSKINTGRKLSKKTIDKIKGGK
jgi:group I intron endonuclease